LQPFGCKQITDAELANLRLDWLLSVAQQSSGPLLEAPAMDGFSWLVRWTSSLLAAVQQVEKTGEHVAATSEATQVSQPAGDVNGNSRTRSLAWIEQMAEFFDVTLDTLVDSQQPISAGSDPGRLAMGTNGEVASFVSDGDGQGLSIRLQATAWSASHSRNFALATVGMAVLVAIWVVRSPQLAARLEQWPEASALVLGVAAWLWLRPSLVGLVVAIVAAVLLVRRLRRDRKSPRHDSSKLPNPIPGQMA
jgi:hypothetical protein